MMHGQKNIKLFQYMDMTCSVSQYGIPYL